MIRQYELVERIKSYDPKADEDALNRAYIYSMKKHGTQKRASGEDYFSHPLEVAGILTDMRLDTSTIITALLHDTVEDTDATIEEVEELFGAEIARLVNGVTKLTQIELQSENTKQAENFSKLLIAMSEDIRVLLVKLADRLHNMRTLHYVKDPAKRRQKALETMEIYAPLAQRIGIEFMKDELEDISFMELYPDARESIISRLGYLRQRGSDIIGRVIDELKEVMQQVDIKAMVSGREKSPYSIWKKMQRKKVEFEQLADIMAFRVVVDNIEECYKTLGIIHSHYAVVPGRFKDYISTPKPNGYQSIHTSVIGPERQRIEIQIRTMDMHEIAEHGLAAHWQYKQGTDIKEGKQYRWLRELLDILEHASDPEEFLEHTKLEMFQDQVFCFTPKGELISLPQGSTPVDFAYAVHSGVGDTCVGAKVNGRIVPLRTILQNGDQVDIVTSKAQTPSPTWEQFVITGKAKTRIRRFIRQQKRSEYIELGKVILQKTFRQEDKPLKDNSLEPVIKKLNVTDADDVYALVGEGIHTGREIFTAIYPDKPSEKQSIEDFDPGKTSKKLDQETISIKGLIPGMAMHFARCCHPLPGDRIVGIVTSGKGVTIHTVDCNTLESFSDQPERWLDVAWSHDSGIETHIGRLEVMILNELGSLGALTTIIGRYKGNIQNMKIINRTPEFFEVIVDVGVSDVRQLTEVIAALRADPAISSVDRARA